MRTIVPFNTDWLFYPAPVDDDVSDAGFQQVTLPHTNVLLPHRNFDNAEYQFISTYRKRFTPPPLEGRRVHLDFDGVMLSCTARINDHTFLEHRGGYTPFTLDLTEHLQEGENLLTVSVDSNERPDIPPYGGIVDYLTFGGMYRDVHLSLVPPCYVSSVFVKTEQVLLDPTVHADVFIRNQDEHARQVEVWCTLRDRDERTLKTARATVSIPARSDQTMTLRLADLGTMVHWSLDHPVLYYLDTEIVEDGTPVDLRRERFGFREAEFRPDGSFYLNGERVKLRGLNRHQTYPYIGQAAPRRLQRKDADILKNELACSIVRTSHYPQSPHFLDRCDEIGLLVFEEIPGWQHIGDEDWQALSLDNVRAMIERDRNHPSIVLWGVRINESPDSEAFYTATNRVAHEIDPTRQTGGVRNFPQSQFLEDVFTYNDFSNTIQEPIHVPHLVTEYMGHMFPTKSWDHEERLVEHALRHARIQNQQMGMNNVAGAVGWCAFDYNTHAEFGAGDRICYHGVMDIFRLPKFAAFFYESQQPPDRRVVLQAATRWERGDISGLAVDPLVIFSNCDEIEVVIGKRHLGRFQPDRDGFPHLTYPPYRIPGRILAIDGDWPLPPLRITGYVDGRQVAQQMIVAGTCPYALTLDADDFDLSADGSDMTRIVCRIVDPYGKTMPYAHHIVSFTLGGPGDLLGENPLAPVGGQAAVFVRARREPGTIVLRATAPHLAPASVRISTLP